MLVLDRVHLPVLPKELGGLAPSLPGIAVSRQQLPVDGDYVVYCRSGNRSAQAAAIMAGLGFENVTDAGGIQSASGATGLPIVTG